MIKLYDYQEQALAAEAAHRLENPDETRLAIVMATGLGKTMVGAKKAVDFLDSYDGAGQRVLILVHTDELTSQFEKRARLVAEAFPIMVGAEKVVYSVGVVKAERDETEADIVVASVQTLANPSRRARLTDVGLVIVDECHHATAASYRAIMQHYGCFAGTCSRCWGSGDTAFTCPECCGDGERPAQTPALGLTATLERSDGQGLGEVWQAVVFSRDISWAVRHGHLVQPIGYRLEIEPGAYNVRHSGDVHTAIDQHFSTNPSQLDAQLADSIAPERVVDKWRELAKGRPTVLFAPLVHSAEAFADAFRTAGISAAVIHGDLPDKVRRATLAQYERGEINVLCNAMVLTEGWDSPRTKCVIIARPTKSRPLAVQMAGRGLRRDPLRPVEEQDCILIFLADATADMCTIADLSDKTLDRRAEGALTAMEDQWDIGKGIEDAERHWAGKVDATQFNPVVTRSSKVWRTTKGGIPFLPISKQREYVFVVGTDVWVRSHWRDDGTKGPTGVTRRIHRDLPDLELALQLAEDAAVDRGGDVGALLADRSRAWRRQVPRMAMQDYAVALGLASELDKILASKAGQKAGRLSDLIGRVEATRVIDPLVKRIQERETS